MAIINFFALALALSGTTLAHGYGHDHDHHHGHYHNTTVTGTGAYYPGLPTRLPTHPPHDGGHGHRTTLTSRTRLPTALPSGPWTGVTDDPQPPYPTGTDGFPSEPTNQIPPPIVYPTGTGGLCFTGNCTHVNATGYAFVPRAVEPTQSLRGGDNDHKAHGGHEGHEDHPHHGDHGKFDHTQVNLPTIVPTETPVVNGTEEGLGKKLPRGFAHISTFLTRGKGVAMATGAAPNRGF